jgi:hypothetical protein
VAVIPQRRQPNFYRPPIRQIEVAHGSERNEETPLPLGLSLAFVAVPTILLIFYISAFAQMAEANFRKVKLLEQLRNTRTTHRLLHTEWRTRSSKENIETWALTHGMERGQNPLLLVKQLAQKGQ